MTRRGFLKWLIAGFGALSLAGVLYPVARFLKPPAAVSAAIGQVVNVGALETFPAGQLTAIIVGGQPAAVQNLNGKYTVYSLICTHLGCVLGVTGDTFACPCHGSKFSATRHRHARTGDAAAADLSLADPERLAAGRPDRPEPRQVSGLVHGRVRMSATTEGSPGAPCARASSGLVPWVVRRLGLTATMEDQYNRIVPKHATNYIYCFGGVAFILFVILAVTGILLAVYYQPTPDTAYQSVLNISTHVQFGWWIRSIHRWAAGGMVLLVFVHLLRVFFTGAYKAPRELNWLTGVALLLITLGFGFTGYLLPWDQKAYWATKVGTDIAGSVPLIGHFLLVTPARRRPDQRRHAWPPAHCASGTTAARAWPALLVGLAARRRWVRAAWRRPRRRARRRRRPRAARSPT